MQKYGYATLQTYTFYEKGVGRMDRFISSSMVVNKII